MIVKVNVNVILINHCSHVKMIKNIYYENLNHKLSSNVKSLLLLKKMSEILKILRNSF